MHIEVSARNEMKYPSFSLHANYNVMLSSVFQSNYITRIQWVIEGGSILSARVVTYVRGIKMNLL
jgi:hypothetical protein